MSTLHSLTAGVRGYATDTEIEKGKEEEKEKEGNGEGEDKDLPRFNALGVQQLSHKVHSKVFSGKPTPPPPEIVELSKTHLTRHGLYGKNTDQNPPISFDLPPLRGKSGTLDEHFYQLGLTSSYPYLDYAKKFAGVDLQPPPPPGTKWGRQSGWTKYKPDGTATPVKYPTDDMLVFDVEVLYKDSPFAVIACAAGTEGWYAWVSPWILGESKTDRHLVPLGLSEKPRVIVGHNVGYDRARIKEEYSLKKTSFAFLDTMSLHVATNGMCSRQRPTWLKHQKLQKLKDGMLSMDAVSQDTLNMLEEEEEAWIARSSINSLQEVALFHCDIQVDKGVRDQFGIINREGVLKQLDTLLDYCAADVATTHKVYKKVLPNFLEVCPHPVSFAALRHLSSVVLPVDKTWEDYIKRAEDTYIETSEAIKKRLIDLANGALAHKNDSVTFMADPWLRQLDWTIPETRTVKIKGQVKGEVSKRPAKNQKMPGEPKWYKDLFTPGNAGDMKISVRSRIAPLLLKLAWDEKPLVWSDVYGWVVRVPVSEKANYEDKALVKCDMAEEKNGLLNSDRENIYYKLPHKDGPTARCVSPLAKSYLKYFEDGMLSSPHPLAKEALKMNAECSYWISARERIKGQMVIYESDVEEGYLTGMTKTALEKSKKESGRSSPEVGIILPQLIPMGTVTRRAVERTWLTASNAKKNRLGSELKAMIKAPPGYVFVGSDVDSQELWIASLVGDAQFKLHGGNAIGFMTLEGTKAAGTDLHSKTASILGISRNHAKIFNYGRIYGAGVKFASTLLKQFNPTLPDSEADQTSQRLYKETKGTKTKHSLFHDRPFWRGGTESFVFNKLEEFANQDLPRTPVLGAGITEALRREYLTLNGFMPSRINWAIQSSGVDYLHLLIIAMEHLITRFRLSARLAITVHDEIRYLVKDMHKYHVAMALQIANLWTRAMFSQQMGIEDLPQSCAYFSAIDIDSVLRKEVDMDCITPSQPNPIPPGESINMTQLLDALKKGNTAFFQKSLARGHHKLSKDLEDAEYTPRTPVMEQLQGGANIPFLRAQNADDEEFRKLVGELKKKYMFPEYQKAKPSPVEDMIWNAPPVVAKTYEETHEAVSSSVKGQKWQSLPTNSPHVKRPFAMSLEFKLEVQEARKQTAQLRRSDPVKSGTSKLHTNRPKPFMRKHPDV
ncbi:DNA polymerase gamma [Morchella conica CCBAS932]|uniref:DNA-directed DNA polymerase n=2 Tax=Morchella sect. Distantes TaxID=1051054 RepID=A0A3N4KX54_9PEZI|nr:DNA polymerase gamma [Morchella conica CCBAS932]